MANDPHPIHTSFLRAHISEFWSGDLGLTLMNMALCVLIFVITPLREAGLHGRILLDLAVLVLMISAALAPSARPRISYASRRAMAPPGPALPRP